MVGSFHHLLTNTSNTPVTFFSGHFAPVVANANRGDGSGATTPRHCQFITLVCLEGHRLEEEVMPHRRIMRIQIRTLIIAATPVNDTQTLIQSTASKCALI